MTHFFLATIFLLIFILQQARSSSEDPCTPKQIHLALSDAFTSSDPPASKNTMKVIFHTEKECKSAYISLITPHGETKKVTATAVNLFTEKYNQIPKAYKTYIHVFDFLDLEFSQTYEYSCYGSDQEKFLSKYEGPFKFYVPSPNSGQQKETRAIMFADMDHSPEGMTTINRLSQIAQSESQKISAFIHNGDMAYNLYNGGGKKGDDYMNTIQKFTATMPYMVTAGNHEDFGNFSNFNARFQMPMFEKSNNHFYSFNLGNIHFVSFNLDFILSNPKMRPSMLKWLEQDLKKADRNRQNQPWIVAYTHRPLYCSYPCQDCNKNSIRFKDFEDLLNRYNVDLLVGGHVHAYERMLPIKRGRIAQFKRFPKDKRFNHIVNPTSLVHVVQGMAGHKGDEGDPQGVYKGREFTVKVDKAYSFLQVSSKNSTHLLVENFRSADGKVNDYFYIVKSNEPQYEKLPNYYK